MSEACIVVDLDWNMLINFSNLKVIQNVGLCIGFYDLLESSDGLIGHGTGLVNVNGKLFLKALP